MSPRVRTIVVRCLVALALIYAFLAGLRTVARADLGWQLAAGRRIVQNHSLPSTDVFSHTARGHEWIYPALSEVVLYALERVSGFAALSWLGAIVCLATVLLLVRRDSVFTTVLAILAVPLIAARTAPRAEMFTLLFFAAYLSILWREHRTHDAPLWVLPVLMLLWVNLHPGFIAGLAMIVGLVILEIGDAPGDRVPFAEVGRRLRRSAPWLALSFLVTLANPWGWRIYHALVEQERALRQHALWFAEWAPPRFTTLALRQALSPRNPDGALVWLLAVGIVAMVLYILQRRIGSAVILDVAAWQAMQHERYDALFACLVVVLSAPAFAQALRWLQARFAKPHEDAPAPAADSRSFGLAAVLALVLAFVGLRGFDLVTNRAYLATMEGPLFGAGLSSTYPRAAAGFIREHHLPREILNDYSTGGYWLWALGPEYPDYVDGRALPFGPEIIQRSEDLLGRIPPDSPLWDQEAPGIQTVAVGLGASNFAALPAFCRSPNWTAVYLDAWAAVFVRRDPAHPAFDNLRLDCATAPVVTDRDYSPHSSGERFYALVSGARVLHLLGRDAEALARIGEAQAIFGGNPDVEMQRGLVLFSLQRVPEAEQALRRAVDMRPTAQTCSILGQFYAYQKRAHSAISAYRCAAALAPYPGRLYLPLAQLQMQANDPGAALQELDRAWRRADEAGPQAARFRADVSELRAHAYWLREDRESAAREQRTAAELDATNPLRWQHLAELYQALGRNDEAAQARQHAQQLSR